MTVQNSILRYLVRRSGDRQHCIQQSSTALSADGRMMRVAFTIITLLDSFAFRYFMRFLQTFEAGSCFFQPIYPGLSRAIFFTFIRVMTSQTKGTYDLSVTDLVCLVIAICVLRSPLIGIEFRCVTVGRLFIHRIKIFSGYCICEFVAI